MKRITVCAALLFLASMVRADDIDGVQPAALDQPRVNVVVRRTAGSAVLMGKNSDGELFNVEAFLDTGASSIALSSHTAELLGVSREKVDRDEVRFQDVGVGGGSEFAVSEPIFLSIAPMAPNVNVEDKEAIAGTYKLNVGPVRTEIGPLTSGLDFLSELAIGDLDIVGMPAIRGKIIVMDTKDVNAMTDKIRTYVYDAADANHPAIPKTSQHVKLNYVSFARYTKVSPVKAEGPAIGANPMIGTVAGEHGKTVAGNWLLDTGAAVSMISRKRAAELGITYIAETDGTGHPKLAGTAAEKQFVMTVGGIGGSKKSAGFYLDKLTVPTIGGGAIVYDHAPVLAADITVEDEKKNSVTLDGVFGMNFLVATAMVDESSLVPDVDRLTPGAFRWVVIDEPEGWVGVEREK